MDIVIAYLILFLVQSLWERLVRKVPVSPPHEVQEQYRQMGFVEAVFGFGQSRVVAFAVSFLYGLLVGKWWLGPCAIVLDLAIGTMTWFVFIKPRQS